VPKPLAISYGTAEVPALVHDSRNLFARREAEGAPGLLVPIEGADHFTILEELRRPDGRLVEVARALVAGHRS
jgi:arylformamidase